MNCNILFWHESRFVVVCSKKSRQWACCQIRKIASCAGKVGTFSPPLRVRDPDMHHGTCVAGENVPGIPGASATRYFTYLSRGPCDMGLRLTGYQISNPGGWLHQRGPVKAFSIIQAMQPCKITMGEYILGVIVIGPLKPTALFDTKCYTCVAGAQCGLLNWYKGVDM